MPENKKEWTMEEIAAQLRTPEGEDGLVVASNMQKTNSNLYKMALSFFPNRTDLRLLEIGFGNGEHFSNIFQSFPGISIYGADISKTMCEEVGRRYLKEIEKEKMFVFFGDAQTMPYENGFFDIVLCINTIYFWHPIQNYFKEIVRVLKPGGRFIVGFRPAVTMQQLSFTRYGFTLYDAEEVKGLLTHTGFASIEEKSESYQLKSVSGELVDNLDVVLCAAKP